MTYTIEDLKPGMSESFTKTVTERDIQLFGEVSGDMNPSISTRHSPRPRSSKAASPTAC